MSVSKRKYRPFTGTPTRRSDRFLVLMRYALNDVWASRITNVLCLLCGAPVLLAMTTIYVMNSPAIRLLIASNAGAAPAIAINEMYFFVVLQGQCWLAMVLIAWIGPRIIGMDFANNALPTILSHPISRTEYVLAKLALLAAFLSAVTWVPFLFLFIFQSWLSTTPWAFDHMHIAYGGFIGSAIWIIVLCLVTLAVSCWVRWRIVATAMVIAAIFVPAGMGRVFNAVMRTDVGMLVSIPSMMFTLWHRLLHVQFRFRDTNELSTAGMLVSIAMICALCAFALNARIRAREVVRG